MAFTSELEIQLDSWDASLAAKEIFGAALEVAAEGRSAFAINACAGDAGLQSSVTELLEIHEKAGRFLDPDKENNHGGSGPDEKSMERLNWLLLEGQPGSTIDRYKLLEVIGEGGHGIVFRAQQEKPVQRLVALKVVKNGLESESVRQRFESERQTLAIMDHPNIAKLFDAGTTEHGRPYFVMELVLGIPVTQFCDQHRLTIRRRVELFIAICRAVHHAHQRGIIHRDLKPSNILVTETDGIISPKVIDFGVSRPNSGSPADEDLHEGILGTPQYMSPEQATNTSIVDTRSDVYALGAMLYELLTGVTAIGATSRRFHTLAELREAFEAERPVPPSERILLMSNTLSTDAELAEITQNRAMLKTSLSSSLKEELDWIVMKAIQRERERRYDSVAAMADDLQRYLDRRPILAAPSSVTYIGRRFLERNKTVATLSMAIVVSLLGSLYAVTVSLIHMRAARDRAVAAEKVIVKSEADAVAMLRNSYSEQARTGEHSRLPGQRIASLRVIAKAAAIDKAGGIGPSLQLRNQAIACMSLPDVELVEKWDSQEIPWTYVVHNAQMSLYAVGNTDGTIRLFRESDRAQIGTLESFGDRLFGNFCFSPDDRYLSVCYQPSRILPPEARPPTCRLRIWDLQTKRPAFELKATSAVQSVSFSHDSAWLAITKPPGTLQIIPLPAGGNIRSLPHAGVVSVLAVQPGDQRIAVAGNDPGARLVSLDNNEVRTIPTSISEVLSLAWHPDGQQLAIGGSVPTARVEVVNVVTGKTQADMLGHILPAIRVAFTHDGRYLFSGGWDSQIRLWDRASGATLLSLDGFGETLQVADDGRLSFNNTQGHRAWKLVSSEQCHVLVGVTEDFTITSQDFSPDGRLLAAATAFGIRLWNIQTAQQLGFVTCPGPRTVLFNQDGTRILVSSATGLLPWKVSDMLGHDDPLPAQRADESKTCAMAATPDWRKIVFGTTDGTLLVSDPNRLSKSIPFGQQYSSPRFVAISPDGAWAATSARFGRPNSFNVWNLSTHTLVKALPLTEMQEEAGQVAFSADGKFLITADSLADAWYSVGDWKPIRRVDRKRSTTGLLAFSPDGKLLALSGPRYSVVLADPATGQEFATLDTQIPHSPACMTFSKDSTQLAISGAGASAIVWDLRQIRRELASMNLDWH